MANQLLIGSQSASDGAFIYPRGGRQGNALADKLHGDMYEQAFKGNLYSVTNQAAVTTTAALATTWTGLAIANPAGSGVNLVLRTFSCAQYAVGAAGAVGVMVGTGAAAGSLTVRSARTGAAYAGVTTASAGATIATPILERVVGAVGSLATTGYGAVPAIVHDFNGSLLIAPGYFVASYTTAVTTTALIFGFVWEEVPIG